MQRQNHFPSPQIFFALLAVILPNLLTAQRFETQFEQQLDSLYDLHKDAVGVLMHIESPDKNISWTYAVGFSDRESKEILQPEAPVLIASNTKTYVAAAILRLVEEGAIELDAPIQKYVRSKTCKKFKKIGYDFQTITVRNLLSHTSGIHDYVDDEYFEMIAEKPQYHWKKKKQVKRSQKLGDPLFEAGTAFKYGDINYLLLTEIIEETTDQNFYEAINDLLKFDVLELNSTWFEGLQPKPRNVQALAHQYADIYDWDSYDLNPSWDLYGGGGIASTVKETALFYQYLFEGKIIQDSAVLSEMYQYVVPKDESKYCLGIWNMPFPNFSAYYHGGWWGTDVAYIPETNTSVAVFTLQKSKRGEFARLSIDMMNTLAQASKHELISTPNYDLYRAKENKGVLILFPGGGTTAKETKEEFDVLEAAEKRGISVLMSNFNRHLWLDSTDKVTLRNELEKALLENDLNTDKVYIGGMSIGGNVALTLSSYLIEMESVIQPKGTFVVDSPIDLYALYESSQRDIANPNFSEERLEEPRWIVEFFEEEFGTDSLLNNIEKVAPFTLKNGTIGVGALKECQLRFYIEPDVLWYKENRGIDFESTNAYTIQEIAKYLTSQGWNKSELMESENRGYRANGERNPHSWSIVEVNALMDWMLK